MFALILIGYGSSMFMHSIAGFPSWSACDTAAQQINKVRRVTAVCVQVASPNASK